MQKYTNAQINGAMNRVAGLIENGEAGYYFLSRHPIVTDEGRRHGCMLGLLDQELNGVRGVLGRDVCYVAAEIMGEPEPTHPGINSAESKFYSRILGRDWAVFIQSRRYTVVAPEVIAQLYQPKLAAKNLRAYAEKYHPVAA